MKRRTVLLLLLGIGFPFLFFFLATRPKHSRPKPRVTGSPSAQSQKSFSLPQPSGPPQGPPGECEDKDGARLLSRALEVRRKARTDMIFLAELLVDLENPSLDRSYRERVALILGTLDRADVQHALLRALMASTDSRWTIVLLTALGTDKSSEDDAIFDLEDAPFVTEVAGFRMRIKTRISDAAIWSGIERTLDDADLEVRRAAARAVVHSTESSDIRRRFATLVRSEPEPPIRAAYGHALAEWAAGQTPGTAERDVLLSTLLDVARNPDEEAVRFRLEEPLRRAPLSESETQSIIVLSEEGNLDQRLWGLSILRGKAFAAPENLIERLATSDAEPKVREYAVNVLAELKSDVAMKALILSSRDDTWHVRLAAVRALANHSTPVVSQRLHEMAAFDPDERVRMEAQSVLK